ncbi:related to hard surface induced protein 3 (sterol glycosyl transferase) [Fusarium oxysporum]|uniref:Related to hard surface induced protein 3 (Sterol glycosyl transferase) n=1 Tax=Fusarium oxysporum TaxID=5507 RepID=A0A2H3SLJ3_FUSOX|nr:related to hard surface induced protein 3 (sterol glycosyl transferase) [Fusarium oxysporum]
MSPRTSGLLDSDDWDEVKTDSSSDWTLAKSYSSWKPAAAGGKLKHFINITRAAIRARTRPLENLRPTAYLDGLRGFAALLVYFHHHELWVRDVVGQKPILENSFGYGGKHYFASFPFIRHFFTGGHYAVSTFFIISGYVLSLKPMGLIQSGEHAQLGDVIASSLFRRWIRLYLPIIMSMLVYITLLHMFGVWVRIMTQQKSWYDELWAFYYEFKNFSFVFKEGGEPWLTYNRHLWSIPIEFKGSVVIFTAQMAFSRCSKNARLWCETGLIFYFMYIADGSFYSMFTAGMLLCDLDLLASKGDLPRWMARLEPAKEFIFYHLLIFSLFLGGVPSENRNVEQLAKNRGFYYLSWFKPQAVFDYKWFYLFYASVFLVASVPRIFWLKSFFETRFCQWLGRISFALYLVHGPVLWTIGERFYVAAGWQNEEIMKNIPHWANKLALPMSGPLGLEISFLLPQLILVPLTLGLADVVTRFIDTPSVKFAAWFYKKALGDPTSKQAKA